MEAAAGHEMDDAGRRWRDEIAAETDGNPFFVAELLRHLTESGALVQRRGRALGAGGRRSTELGLPQSVREVVGRRVERPGRGARSACWPSPR